MSDENAPLKFYMIDSQQLAVLRRIQTRLHTENRMTGNEMRDLGHAIQAVADSCEQVEIP